jgi:hypothetical protein
MLVGEFSAEKTGTVTSLRPIPIPSRIRVATSSPQCCVTAMPKGEMREKIAPMKMVPRRPTQLFRGSEIHPALSRSVRDQQRRQKTYKNAIAMYGHELTKPTIH